MLLSTVNTSNCTLPGRLFQKKAGTSCACTSCNDPHNATLNFGKHDTGSSCTGRGDNGALRWQKPFYRKSVLRVFELGSQNTPPTQGNMLTVPREKLLLPSSVLAHQLLLWMCFLECSRKRLHCHILNFSSPELVICIPAVGGSESLRNMQWDSKALGFCVFCCCLNQHSSAWWKD